MAVKSSGQLSLRDDIRAEFGGSTLNVSLRDQASRAGLSSPDAMSEFYGLSARTNDYYLSTRRGWLDNTTAAPGAQYISLGMTFIGWYRVDSLSKKNQILFSVGGNSSSRRGSIFIYYNASLNRIIVQLYDTGNTRRLRREYPLHDSRNRGITGITSSATGWERDQRGNTDGAGFTQLAFTVITSGSSYTGIKMYWNGQELTYSVNNNSSAVRVDNQVLASYLSFNNYHWNGGSSSNFEGAVDNVSFFNYVVGSSTIQSLYNEGNWFMGDIDDGITSPVYAQGFENNITTQVINTWGYVMAIRGSGNTYTSHGAGYP